MLSLRIFFYSVQDSHLRFHERNQEMYIWNAELSASVHKEIFTQDKSRNRKVWQFKFDKFSFVWEFIK